MKLLTLENSVTVDCQNIAIGETKLFLVNFFFDYFMNDIVIRLFL